MSDTMITNTTGCCASDSAELDHLAASLAALVLNYCKFNVNQNGKAGDRTECPAVPVLLPSLSVLNTDTGSNY
jgi:hypothetical protein